MTDAKALSISVAIRRFLKVVLWTGTSQMTLNLAPNEDYYNIRVINSNHLEIESRPVDAGPSRLSLALVNVFGVASTDGFMMLVQVGAW